jgi:hypothetical protein
MLVFRLGLHVRIPLPVLFQFLSDILTYEFTGHVLKQQQAIASNGSVITTYVLRFGNVRPTSSPWHGSAAFGLSTRFLTCPSKKKT